MLVYQCISQACNAYKEKGQVREIAKQDLKVLEQKLPQNNGFTTHIKPNEHESNSFVVNLHCTYKDYTFDVLVFPVLDHFIKLDIVKLSDNWPYGQELVRLYEYIRKIYRKALLAKITPERSI